MQNIVWDSVGTRFYESGISKAVIYLDSGKAMPWNGITSVSENSDRSVTPTYFDGMKVNDVVSQGDFSGTIKAYTYPDEMLELQGLGRISSGVFVGDQQPQTFSLSYQTNMMDDLGNEYYKIHILYNVTAIPSGNEYQTLGSDPDASEFEWSISVVPQEISGFRPSGQLILDSRYIPASLLDQLNIWLYGLPTVSPALPSFDFITNFLLTYYVVEIIDNADGTWTAIADDGYINMLSPTEFEIINVNATYLNPTTYDVSNTLS